MPCQDTSTWYVSKWTCQLWLPKHFQSLSLRICTGPLRARRGPECCLWKWFKENLEKLYLELGTNIQCRMNDYFELYRQRSARIGFIIPGIFNSTTLAFFITWKAMQLFFEKSHKGIAISTEKTTRVWIGRSGN